jgi:hypothetical protein
VSADGRVIVTNRSTESPDGAALVRWQDGAPTAVAGANAIVGSMSRDGSTLTYTTYDGSGSSAYESFVWKDGRVTRIDTADRARMQAVASPDGSAVVEAWGRADGGYTIARMDLSNGLETTLVSSAAGSTPLHASQIAVDADASRVAYTTDERADGQDRGNALHIVDASTGVVDVVCCDDSQTGADLSPWAPKLSADGHQLLFDLQGRLMPEDPDDYNYEVYGWTAEGSLLAPGLSISDVTIHEGESGIATVSLSSPVDHDVHITVSGQSNTASDSDFEFYDGSVTIPAGETFAVVHVAANADDQIESPERGELRIYSSDAPIRRQRSFVHIIDVPPPPPDLSIANTSHKEGNSNATWLYRVSLSAPAPTDVTFSWATRDGSDIKHQATAGKDYVANSGTVTIPRGQTSVDLPVVIIGDLLPETDEVFTILITNVHGAVVARGQAYGTILDDDPVRLPVRV